MNYAKVSTVLVPAIAAVFFFFVHTPANMNQFTLVEPTPGNPNSIHQNLNDVSFLLAKQLISTKALKDRNFVFSPLSIQLVLGMVASGSGGATRAQLLSYLKSNSTEELNSLWSEIVMPLFAGDRPLGGPHLSIANGVWVDLTYRLKESFKNIVENTYGAVARTVDFENHAREIIDRINMWANTKTNGLITEILPRKSVGEGTRLVLANAVYFKGAWRQKFDASMTRLGEFFLPGGSSTQLPFMSSYEDQYVSVFDGFKVARLPYEQGKDKRHFSMYIILPNSRNGLPKLVEKVCSQSGLFIENHFPYEQQVTLLRIPKFKIGYDFEAPKVLQAHGLELPFSGGLTEMADSDKNLGISRMFHKSLIEVDEEGTEAAAVTAAVVDSISKHEALEFVADHPFLFVIREDTTGTVFFIGQVTNPLAN